MKQLLAVALNDLRVEFSDRGTWVQFLILPVIFTAVIGVGTGGFSGDPNADARYPVALVNLDGGALAAQFADALAQSSVVRPEANDDAGAAALLSEKKVRAVVVVPAGFSADLQTGRPVEVEVRAAEEGDTTLSIREAVQSASAEVSRTLMAALVSVEEAESLRPFADEAERQRYFDDALAMARDAAESAPVELDNTQSTDSLVLNTPQGFSQSSPGQLVTWVLGTLLGGASLLVGERTAGTLRRLVTMPAPRWSILGGKILGRFAMGFLQMVVMIVVGALVFGVKWGNSPSALLMVMVAFGLAATALGLFLAAVVRTTKQADGIGTLGVFMLAPLGGAWVPLEITPAAFQQIAQIFPTTWAMRGFTDVIVRGQGPEGVLLEALVLLGFAIVFFALGIWRFKYE
jgi:ABC-2 type transport system permease protein